MALATNALVTAEQLLDYLGTGGSGEVTRLEAVIGRSSTMIETFLDRRLVTRGSVTEYHSPDGEQVILETIDAPIISVTSVHETTERTYDATTLLTVSTDYLVESSELGQLVRVAGLTEGPMAWVPGYRAVKIVYVPGYQIAAGTGVGGPLPQDVVDVALRLSARIWKEQDRRQWDVSSQSDAAGNFTRFGPGMLSEAEKAQLYPYQRRRFAATAVRA